MFAGIKRILSRPIKNLNSFERLILIIRLISTTVVLTLSLTLVIGPSTRPNSLYMAKLNTFSHDISKGIFNTLRKSMESQASSSINNGVGLTTSELYVLTAYSLRQVISVPQYITVSLYGHCSTFFTIEDSARLFQYDNKGSIPINNNIVRNSTEIRICVSGGLDYILDYRDILMSIGLEIILDYAYSNDNLDGNSKMSKYERYITGIRDTKTRMLSMFFVVICMVMVEFVLTIWYYYIKGRYFDTFKEKILIHTISLLSLVIFICGVVSLLTFTWLNFSLQKKITTELEKFGFSYHLGSTWFVCMWVLIFFLFVSCLVWSGLEWCIADSTAIEEQTANGDSTDPMFISNNNVQGLLDEPYQENDLEDNREFFNEYSDNEDFEDDTQADFMRSSCLEEAFSNSRRDTITKRVKTQDFSDLDSDRDLDEQFEMQSITLRSSNESERGIPHAIVPSSTMHF